MDRESELASSPTLCRLENRADRLAAWALHKVLLEQFIASHKSPPKELILDFDAAHHAAAVLKLLVKGLREAWPQVKITIRADSGFCRQRLLNWCERNEVHYIVGLAKNARLNALSAKLQERAQKSFEATGEKQRLFGDMEYAAGTWRRERRVIAKAEVTDKGPNPRYVVTDLEGDAQALYDGVYCARGEMENRIKEQQLGLFADRTSCSGWPAQMGRAMPRSQSSWE